MSQEDFEGLSEDLGDFLEPLDAGFSRPGADEVDDMLDVIAREVNDNAMGQDGASAQGASRRGSNVSLDLDPIEFEAFTESLEESLAKFDDFLERANATNGLGDSEHEHGDQLTELRPIESLREKRSRDQGNLQLGASPFASGMAPRIRNISGEKLSSMPAMHHGYATTSSLNKNNTFGSGASAPQKNQTWDKPEPVLGEVTGNKMRRLLSDKSYFQARPNTSEASKNAPWNQPKAAPAVNARTAMQSLLYGGSSQGSSQTTTAGVGARTSGWPGANPSNGGVTLQQMQQFASTGASFPSQTTATPFQNAFQTSGVTQSTGVAQNAPNSSFATVSLQDMQRLAAAGVSFSAQAASTTTGTTPQNTATQAQTTQWSTQQQPAFAAGSLQAMMQQRLAYSQPAPAAAASVNVGQNNIQNGGFVAPAPGPAFASVSLQDMQRLAATGVSVPTQAAPVATSANAGQTAAVPAKPVFASVSLQDMQRLASTGATFPAQASAPAASARVANAPAQAPTPPWSTAPKPTFAAVTLEDMQRLANTTASLPTAQGATAASSGGAVQNPPWAAQTQTQAVVTMQDMQRLASTGAGVQSQSASNQLGGISQSYGNMAQAGTASKPVFTTVSLEDMHRLASTGVSRPTPTAPSARAQGAESAVSQNAPWNAPKSSTGIAPMGGVQQSTSSSAAVSSQTTPAGVSTSVAPTQQAAPKPTFANVTLEDMQRLVNAYSEHQKPVVVPAVSAKETQPVSIAQKPAPMVSVEEMQHDGTAESESADRSQGNAFGSQTENRDETQNSTNAVHEDDGARKNVALASATTASESKNENVICMDTDTPPKKVSGGAMQRMLSEASYFQSTSAEPKAMGTTNAAWPEAVVSNEDTDKAQSDTDDSESDESDTLPSDPDEMLKKLRALMDRSSSTQSALQDFDKKRGLPRSHSQTMVNSSRSRKQLLEGKIIAKWDGSPLISEETELGKPRPRKASETNESRSDRSPTGTAATAFAAI